MDADVAVIGLGAMGSMALWRLAARGARVIGVEQFTPGHDRGSSHGESRIIRTAYFEGPHYVPLLRSAFDLWRLLEGETGADLLTMTGALMIGPINGHLVRGALASARLHGLAHEVLDTAAMRRRYPQHHLRPDDVAVREDEAGFLRPERAIRAAVERAEALGARVERETPIVRMESDGASVIIDAGDRSYCVGHAVVAVGPWLPSFMPTLPVPLRVERQFLSWFPPRDPAAFAPERFPVFMREWPAGRLRYGFPTLDGATVKMAIHHEGPSTSVETVDRTVSEGDIDPLRAFLEVCLPDVAPSAVRNDVCMYTDTPDEHFVVGSPPGQPQVTVLSCCSGHGFKFAPIVGDVAADLVLTKQTDHPIGPFALDRFARAR